jgi:anti-sigma regulatory factor (Ser/Thr protein kinase)
MVRRAWQSGEMPPAPNGTVSLVIPADALYVRVARLTASGFGALHEMTIDDLDDLRLVVDELCGFFIDLGTTQAINIELRPREGAGIEIIARAPAPPEDSRGLVDELRQQVMEALTDQLHVDLGAERTEVHATVVPGS